MFARGPVLGFRLVILSLISIALMIVDHQRLYTASVRSVLAVIVSPIQYVANLPVQTFEQLQATFMSHGALLKENARLKTQQLILVSQVQKLLAIEKENDQLKALVSATTSVHDKVVLAQLLAVNTNVFTHEAIINKGSLSQIYMGQPVLDAYGVLGQVIAVDPFTSKVLMISDTRSAVPVEDARSEIRSIAVGTGTNGKLMLINVPDTADIKQGDVLVSSGLGQRFPPGYPVGKIESISKDTGSPFLTITVMPFAHLNRTRHVMLVWFNPMGTKING